MHLCYIPARDCPSVPLHACRNKLYANLEHAKSARDTYLIIQPAASMGFITYVAQRQQAERFRAVRK